MGLFSGSIPPWFVLSNNLSTTNTRAIWLCFGAFLSPPASSHQFHWPLATDHHSPVPRSTPGPAGSGRAQTLPRWLLPDTDRRIAKDRMGLIWPSGLSTLLCTEPGDSCGKSNPFSPPARRRWTGDHSLAAGGAPRQRLEARLPDAHQTQCLLSRCSP